MPYVAALRPAALDNQDPNGNSSTIAQGNSSGDIHQMPLFLPSSLPIYLRDMDPSDRLRTIERELRLAQMDDSLEDIRRLRRIMAGVTSFKHLNVSGSGQKGNTRMQNLYDKFLL